MSPIEYIEEGIRKGNWETVNEGYERLTGKAVPLPFPKTAATMQDVENALKKIAYIVSSVLDGPIAEICNTTSKSVKRKPGRPKRVNNKITNKKSTVTQEGQDSSLKLDDKKITIVQKNIGNTQLITNDPDPEEVAKNIDKAKRTAERKIKLKRQAIKTYKVQCNECEAPFQSNRPKGEMGQKCPKCLKTLKGRFSS